MKIHRIESSLIPNTLEGQKFSKEYAERLKNQGAFKGWLEDATNITITAEYIFDVEEKE